MGWSCTAKASCTLDAITDHFRALGEPTSNGMGDGWFWDTSRRDHADGAITGDVWKPCTHDGKPYSRRAGSLRIEGDGRIARFPHLPTTVKRACEAAGAARYCATVERVGDGVTLHTRGLV